MTTTWPRYQITATPAVQAAISSAERVWPGEPTSRLLTRLVDAGARTLRQGRDAEGERLEAMTKYAPCYAPAYLDELRAEWER
jgi:hypothetical protein